MISVLVVDDDHLMRAGLIELLGADSEIAVAGHADSGVRAIEMARLTTPDVVLMDVRMPNGDGIGATATIVAELPDTKVLVLTTFDDDNHVFDALDAGASGFLLKRARPEELLEAVHIVASGDALLAPSITRRVIERLEPRGRAENNSVLDVLTDRERDVMACLGRGLSNAEIADELFVEESTVRTHVKRIFQKLGLRDRIQAVIFSYENGLTPRRS